LCVYLPILKTLESICTMSEHFNAVLSRTHLLTLSLWWANRKSNLVSSEIRRVLSWWSEPA